MLLAQLVCKQALDDNAFWLADNARKFMIDNGVTRSYFDNKEYVMTGGKIKLGERDIIPAAEVSANL